MNAYYSLVAQRLKRLTPMQETRVRSLGREDPLEKEMATHSSILAWRISWTEEPGGLQSTGLQRVGHDWATSLSLSLRTTMAGSYSRFMFNFVRSCQIVFQVIVPFCIPISNEGEFLTLYIFANTWCCQCFGFWLSNRCDCYIILILIYISLVTWYGSSFPVLFFLSPVYLLCWALLYYSKDYFEIFMNISRNALIFWIIKTTIIVIKLQ